MSIRQISKSVSCLVAAIAIIYLAIPCLADGVITLKNGFQIEGKLGKVSELGENPLKPSQPRGGVRVTEILLVDDDLRRIFVPSKQVTNISESPPGSDERISIRQRVATKGRRIASVGPILRVEPFDEWGRRVFTMHTARGPVNVVQGVTLVTPKYCRVQGLLGQSSYVWDMRIATSSIPRKTLSRILMKQIDTSNPADRKRIVRLYIQAERYEDAQNELEQLIADFPRLAVLENQVRELRQFAARRMIREVERRRDAGQHRLAVSMLETFPTRGVASENLLRVRDMLAEYEENQDQGERALQLFQKQTAEISDDALRAKIETIYDEIKVRLNHSTLNRMADYLRLADDQTMDSQQKLALAISGWLLGSGSGTNNLAVVTDLIEVRRLVREYLVSPRVHRREEILAELKMLEGSQPSFLAQLIAHMEPAERPPVRQDGIPGLHRLSVAGLTGEPDFSYYVQLPPEYDPLRRYPCIVTLNGAGTTPLHQIDWWSGGYDKEKQVRLGQATRRGYIVVAPVWSAENQSNYDYSAREHAAVLYCLRDACRRFSVDTNRMFLSGHSMGGDAAWDIGLAHPDLWAGLIPFVATADRYVSRYFENARNQLPMYFVGGELDGNRMDFNKMDLNRYLRYAGYDVVVVQYQGRGHEHFHDEIQHVFDWMEMQRRNFFPSEFMAVSMRQWDNFFWWAELDDFPANTIVSPLEWPRSGAKEAETEGKLLKNNTVKLSTAARKAVLWLSPEMVDFDKRVTVLSGRRRFSDSVQPSAKVLLDDVRTRGDRQYPFWAKLEVK